MTSHHTRPLCGLLRRFLRCDNGATIIETAIVLPMVVLLVMGTIEMGIVFYLSSLANFATNDAARLGKTGYTYGRNVSREQLVYDTVNEYLGPWVSQGDQLQLSTQSFGGFRDFGAAGVSSAGGAGDIVVYTATLNWKIFTPIFAQIIGDNGVFPIKSRVVMKNENF